MEELVKQLTGLYGPSGRETEVADLIEKLLKGKVDSFHRDPLGNLICEKKGTDKKGKRAATVLETQIRCQMEAARLAVGREGA